MSRYFPLQLPVRHLCVASAALLLAAGAQAQTPAMPTSQATPAQAMVISQAQALRDLLREQRVQAEKARQAQQPLADGDAFAGRQVNRKISDTSATEPFGNAAAMDSRLSEEERRLLRDQVRDVHKAQRPLSTHVRAGHDS